MRKLVVGTFLTLDGVMQAPGGPDEDRDGGFRHGGWLVPYFDEKFAAIMGEWTTQAGAFLLGRKTYEMFAASWPNATDPADENAKALNTRPKYVASRTLDKLTWNNSHLLKGEVAEEVLRLKAQEGGEIQVHGSRGAIPRGFRLVESQQTVTGAVLHVYERAGDLEYGEVEVGEETVIFDSDSARR